MPNLPRIPGLLPTAVALLLTAAASAQLAVPAVEGPPGGAWLRHGEQLLDHEDPQRALVAFRTAALQGAQPVEAKLGLGRSHLMLGQSSFALAYATAALLAQPSHQDAMALCIRALIRTREFDAAVQRGSNFLLRTPEPSSELLAARGSAFFRVQRIEDAATAYQRVVALDPLHAEAHLRLGSGLLPPTRVQLGAELHAAAAALAASNREAAIAALRAVLAKSPRHPIAHRLLGETLFAERTAAGMAVNDGAYAALTAAIGRPDVGGMPIDEFVPGYARLSPARAAVVDRTMAMWRRYLSKLLAVGGRHDLLGELERTTDAEARSNLRGQRTFDGRVWDDVRGVGGPQAATGIEALDDAATFGFDTFAHEVAHQVHYYAFTRAQRTRLRALYQQALAEGRCLDFYAASNEAEYFGQGVEAFACLGKRPGGETTHGHTRFELLAVDPELHAFLVGAVDCDPLATPGRREVVLEAAVAVALRCGRPRDAVVAAGLLSPGPLRERLLADAEQALAAARCH